MLNWRFAYTSLESPCLEAWSFPIAWEIMDTLSGLFVFKNSIIRFSTVWDFLNWGTASVNSSSTLGSIENAVGLFLKGFLLIRSNAPPN